ncbi:hypothetical protein N7474_008384 [Penicillium riverlandense]|uniref:uncharacterized protein n=1 Tax=Penicillium riverlandense TaxID=1903569 RepID=UPI002546BE6B|nr:uncharacterized protein N7474_008384 [Penicillium riverlandense]KAJ5812083.1 hypothetical protein N7474_008384 [Penicillium riverlandense]
MSSFSEQSPQFNPPPSAQPRKSLFGGPSSDAAHPPSQPSQRSLFGGPSGYDGAAESRPVQEPVARNDTRDGDDYEIDAMMGHQQPLTGDYSSDGDSFPGSDEDDDELGSDIDDHDTGNSKQPQTDPVYGGQSKKFVLDRGKDLPMGSMRPNRWMGSRSTYKRVTANDRGAADSIIRNRARDLASHLYNAHAIRKRADKQAPLNIKRWVAWPMPAEKVPRVGEFIHNQLGDPDTWRMPPDPRPSAELEESIMAAMTRTAKESFQAREWELTEVKKSMDYDGKMDSDPEDEDETPLRPVVLADDDQARQHLRPLSRQVISRLDRVLVGLHHSMKGKIGEESTSESSSDADSVISPASKSVRSTSRSQSRGRNRARRNLRQEQPSGSRSQHMASGNEAQDESMPETSRSRGRSRSPNKANQRQSSIIRKHHLRDWSEVMGVASMIGLPSAAVMRASKRCTELFGEDMTFRTFHEGRIKAQAARNTRYEYTDYTYTESGGEIEGTGLSSPPPADQQPPQRKPRSRARRPRSRLPSAPAPEPLSAEFVHSDQEMEVSTPSVPSHAAKGKGPHRKLDLVCPVKKCPRHTNGFSRTWNLNLHMKRVHPSYRAREPSNRAERSVSTASASANVSVVVEIHD